MTKTSARPTAWILATLLLPSLAHAADGAFLEFFELRESLWFLVPFLLSVVILTRVERWVRSLRAALKRIREQRRIPGGSPLSPLVVDSYKEVENHSGTKRCRCGERPAVAYQGPTTSKDRRLWVQIEACPRCDERIQTYFDVTAAQDGNPMLEQPLTPSR